VQIAAIRDEFDCTLCYGLLFEPSTLPCGHSFCKVRALLPLRAHSLTAARALRNPRRAW
jgi:hypothetical protein